MLRPVNHHRTAGALAIAALFCACSSLAACEHEQPEPARMPPAPPPLVPPEPAPTALAPTAAPQQPVAPATPQPVTPAPPREPQRPGAQPSSPAPAPPTSQKANNPPPSEPARPPAEPEQPPRKKVVVPSTDHVSVDVPRGLQALLDADPRMQPWVATVMTVIEGCYSRERSRVQDAAGTIEIALVMHANARPDADVKSVPPQLGGVVACATPQLMRARPPLFTGPEGERHTVKVSFTR
jgi:hypothetical protein